MPRQVDGEGLLRDGSETVPAVPGSWSNRPRRIETESEAFPGRVSLCFLASVLLWPLQFASCNSYWSGCINVSLHRHCPRNFFLGNSLLASLIGVAPPGLLIMSLVMILLLSGAV